MSNPKIFAYEYQNDSMDFLKKNLERRQIPSFHLSANENLDFA